ncbi:type 2 isopentenyl-diphosphate Delta-isomerase [Paenibacillus abyssi]|uniref:Isopentenyl-diphosphate delta-isomerase n=1 Tax=Paenibacillus abyssi TaxID=1340531 RepID=A0A917G3Z8_9BACL|nr:type 2 isopentenyl-diphosphate Delta-isomerase [Paenibacillus abyssi]GGG20723.1 isopentenyl-diphosphate delta-isomerase [Paenibacillus abyssi]
MTEHQSTLHNNDALTARRKGEHIRICLEEQVQSVGIQTGFDSFRFRHCALPELAFKDISLKSEFLGKRVHAPLIVSSMTGGTVEAETINRRLAEIAQSRGWAMGLGSMRAAIEQEALASTFYVRKEAPDIPIIANIGAVQLNYGYGADACRRAVELAEADALVLHLNSMQEIFQPEGDTDFRGLLKQIGVVCRELNVPVGVKEVGWGIDGETAAALIGVGVSFVDVAGAGGTSWSQVEKYRSRDPLRKQAAEAFAGWGNSTAYCVREVRRHAPDSVVIASGGLHNGIDAAKALALGADLAGFGRVLLPRAAANGALSKETVLAQIREQFERIEFELQAAMFGIGAASIEELKRTNRLMEMR